MSDDDGFIADRHAGENAILAASAGLAGIFDAVGEGPASPEEVASAASLDARAVSIVLPALASAGYLREEDGAYAPTPRAREAFGGDAAAGGYRHWLHLLRSWIRLDDVLREGGPVPDGVTEEDEEDRGTERFMAAMAAQPDDRVRGVARGVRARSPEGRRALDLGGGPGRYARALVDVDFDVTLVDVPDVVEHVADAYGLADEERIDLVAGDFMEDPLPDGPFDAVLVSNVTHIYGPGENVRLLRKVREVVEPGGVVAIFDMVRGRSPLAARFAVIMLLRTDGGNTYPEDAYREWLGDAGFAGIRIREIDPERQLITAEAV